MKWFRQQIASKQAPEPKVFLSYEMKKVDSLTPLRNALKDAGFSVILLETAVEKDIGYSIMEMIQSTDILICAGDSMRPWIKAEIAYAEAAHVPVLCVEDEEAVSALAQRVRDMMPSVCNPSIRLKWGLPISISVSLIAVLIQIFILKTWSATFIAIGLLPWISSMGIRGVRSLIGQVRSSRWTDTIADIWRDVDVNARYEYQRPDMLGIDRALLEVIYMIAGTILPFMVGILTAIVVLIIVIAGVVVDCVRYYW